MEAAKQAKQSGAAGNGERRREGTKGGKLEA